MWSITLEVTVAVTEFPANRNGLSGVWFTDWLSCPVFSFINYVDYFIAFQNTES